MARAGRTGGRRRDSSSPRAEADHIIDAALALIQTEGWRGLSLGAIAAAAGLPILDVYRIFPSKQSILSGFYRRLDQIVLADPPPAEADERPRDRVFDLLMRRLDALQPYKPAYDVLRRELPRDPLTALCVAGLLLRSMRWVLEAAEIPTSGARGTISVKLTTAAYLSAMRVWQRDDSPDLARTMAALDARLRRVEGWLGPTPRPRTGEAPIPA
ncbi:MAG: TetR family transcriptional regulator [Alphaproteobacteria bacterium]|nr:TetR family transcriptional regulator [Alphaproteobacteria bacterium]